MCQGPRQPTLSAVYSGPVDESLHGAIDVWCYGSGLDGPDPPDGRTVLRPDETASLPCQVYQREPVACDVSLQPAPEALAYWKETNGIDQYAATSGAAFVVDIDGVGPCSTGEGGSGGLLGVLVVRPG